MASPPTAASTVLYAPHIVDMTLSYATNPTLATCLRVSKQLQEAAGKVLYHTVRVDELNMTGFFRGALVGMPRVRGCAGGRCRLHDDKRLKTIPPLPFGKFKPTLLSYVRVLSLGSHDRCVCSVFGDRLARLLCNLDTLRIVPAPDGMDPMDGYRPQVKLLCHHENECDFCDYADECLIFVNLKPRKIVLRNIDDTPWCEAGWPRASDWNSDRLEEAVWVLPFTGDVYDGGGDLFNSNRHFDHTTVVKVILHAHWEEWSNPPCSPDNVFETADTNANKTIMTISPDFIIERLTSWCRRSGINNTIYGLEIVQFKAWREDWVVTAFLERFPGVQRHDLTSAQLCKVLKDELQTGALTTMRETGSYKENDDKDRIEYKTLEQYAALPESARLYELDDGLGDGFWGRPA
ncbi:hypothetical protein Q8F55_004836 [Vanrija albida]|uniref:F-box domain-containing protein n=1 Tax=Vanrija albida TaxID=181172 RepID=A0ABR3PZY0_9TREE